VVQRLEAKRNFLQQGLSLAGSLAVTLLLAVLAVELSERRLFE
jgi:hypothetical protein